MVRPCQAALVESQSQKSEPRNPQAAPEKYVKQNCDSFRIQVRGVANNALVQAVAKGCPSLR